MMVNKWYPLAVLVCLTISCAPASGGAADTGFVPATIAFTVDEVDLIPEGIAHDRTTGRFFLSSKNKDKIIAIDPDGGYRDFIASGQDGLLGTLGLKVDARRRRLWAASNGMIDGTKHSMIHVFDVDSGKLVGKFSTPAGRQYHLNDLALTGEGGAYITDSQSNHLFTIPPDLSRLAVFIVDPLIRAPNGIAVALDDSLLYVASHYNGILVIDLQDKAVHQVGNPMSLDTGGIDGLVYHGGSLLGVVNAQYEEFEYIVKYRLTDNGREIITASVIDRANPAFVTPTTCVMADDCLFVLAATCLMVFNDGEMDHPELLHPPTVLRYRIEDPTRRRSPGPP